MDDFHFAWPFLIPIIAIIGCLTVASAVTARAQTPSPTTADPSMFVTISGGGQFQTRTFSDRLK